MDISQFGGKSNKKLIGLFNASHCNYEQDRQLSASWEPSLFEMCQIAIKVLKEKGGDKGFFLMVEGGRIDHLEHANEGGITVVAGSPKNQYTVDSDKPVYAGGGDGNYSATPSTPRVPGLYGSDYLIKEVLAFDYAVAQGRLLFKDNASNTLIFSTSDHECGGTAIVGLHDTYDAQVNGTLVRTYALGPKQNGINASSGGGATATTVQTPTNVTRGDVDFGAMSASGWYPNYSTYTFQGRPELWPKVDTGGRRIVVAYASNPLTNGNGANAGGTPGNHTPMDIWVGADDNMEGTFAKSITGKGLLDNTSLTEIMAKFLNLQYPFATTSQKSTNIATENILVNESSEINGNDLKTFPNPAGHHVTVDFLFEEASSYRLDIYNYSGTIVKSFIGTAEVGRKAFNVNVDTFSNGNYIAKLSVNSLGKIKISSANFAVQR